MIENGGKTLTLKDTVNILIEKIKSNLLRYVLFTMSVSLIVAVFVMFTLVLKVYSVEENLIKNASFEEGNGDTPASWSIWAWETKQGVTEFKFEEGEAHSGSRFVTIINNKDNDARYRQMVSVKQESFYRLSCWIKTENVGQQRTGANISLEGRVDTSRDFKGTNTEWGYTEMYIKTGKGINNIVITVGLGGYGNVNKGKASFDDVQMEEVESIPAGAVVAQVEQIVQNDSSQSKDQNQNSSGTESGKPIWVLLPVGLITAATVFYYAYIKRSIIGAKKDEVIYEDDFIPDEDEEDID